MLRCLIALACLALSAGIAAVPSHAQQGQRLDRQPSQTLQKVVPRVTVPRTTAPATTTAPSSGVVELTIGECTGLGGFIAETTECSKQGMSACKTVDVHGTVRVLCIDGRVN